LTEHLKDAILFSHIDSVLRQLLSRNGSHMSNIRDELGRAGGPVEKTLDSVNQGVREGYSLLKKALRLSKQATRHVVHGDTGAVVHTKADLSQIVEDLRARVPVGWLREQMAERASSVLGRLAFVETCVPVLRGEKEFDPRTLSREKLGISVQAWLWALASGPDELSEAMLLIRDDEKLTMDDHIAILRKFIQIAEGVEAILADLEKYRDEVVSISGDRRRNLKDRLRQLREKTISEHRKEVVRLIASIAPDAVASN